jgi:predicted transcriptional regulator
MSEPCSISSNVNPVERLDTNERAVLLLLFDDRAPWTLDELGRELSDRGDAADAVSSLTRAGLVHRLGDFVFPTRAARRSDELYDGAL